EQKAGLKRQRVLDAGVDVHGAFGPEVAAAAMESVHLIEVGELAIHATAAAKACSLAQPHFPVHPRRRGRRACERPPVNTRSGSNGESRTNTEPDLRIRRGSVCALVEAV